jgi:eukaryotic-like serine/threonine-protein kinase
MVGPDPSLSETITAGGVASTLPQAREEASDALPTTGSTLGRYVVTERLGAGAMGVVYAAYDPELDRKVAIKVLKNEPTTVGSKVSQRSLGHQRLLREAKAMAKLHHPNVIVVHDVGTVDEQVFIAMEYLDGGTLYDHLRASPRPWQAVLEMFRRAGAGLAAAHAAGIVHRDFKPQNVLLGSDGRVCVVDFGLAQTGNASPTAELGTSEVSMDSSEDLSRLTHTGAVLGTPAYMAPEQHSQGVVDARSDQFAFCVALYEGLYGMRPFAGDNLATLAYNVLRGDVRPPPPEHRVPRWLHAIVVRGLSLDPDDRHPSMAALLEACEAHPARVRRRWSIALGVAAVAGVGTAGWWGTHGDREICGGGQEKIGQTWNDEARRQVQAAFVSTQEPRAPGVWSSVEREIDAYVDGWTTMYTEACEATRIRAEQSEELLDRRMLCLERRRRELGELIALLVDADVALVGRAEDLVAKLSRLNPCADPRALLGGVDPPAPEVRERVLSAGAALKRVRLLRDVGRFDTAKATLDEVEADLETLDHAPTRVSLLYLQSAVAGDEGRLEDAERLAYESAVLAAECGDDDAAAWAWIAVIRIVGLQQRKLEALPPIIKAGEAALARIENDFIRGTFLATIGTVDIVRGHYGDAEAPLREAHALLSKDLGADDPRVLDAYEMLAVSLQYQRRLEEAEPILREIVGRWEQREMPHPSLGQTLGNLASLVDMQGNDVEARELHARALAALEASYGPDHPVIATVHYHLGKLARRHGDLEIAAEHLAREREILTKAHGPDAEPLAYAHHGQGQLDLARERPEAAVASFRRALEIWEKALGPEHQRLAGPLTGIGKAELMAERADAALEPLERALRLRESAEDVAPDDLADTRFTLARASWERGDPARARALALEARTALEGIEHAAVEEIDAWLTERGLAADAG